MVSRVNLWKSPLRMASGQPSAGNNVEYTVHPLEKLSHCYFLRYLFPAEIIFRFFDKFPLPLLLQSEPWFIYR